MDVHVTGKCHIRKPKFDEKYVSRKNPGHVSNVTCQNLLPAVDRFDATVEWIPMIFLRFFGYFLTQMGPKVDFATGAVPMLLCCNQKQFCKYLKNMI